MNYRPIMGGFIAVALIFSSCSISKYGEKVVTQNWIRWEVKFRNNVSEEDKERAFLLIDRYIIESLYKQKSPDAKLFQINITHVPVKLPNVPQANTARIFVTLGVQASRPAVPTPHPCCPPPIEPGI